MKKTSFLRNTCGQDLIEYSLVLAFVALAAAALFMGSDENFKPTVDVEIGIVGNGRVIAGNQNKACNADCILHFKQGENVTFFAQPADGWEFQGWTDACETTQTVCRFDSIGTSQKLTVTFTKEDGK